MELCTVLRYEKPPHKKRQSDIALAFGIIYLFQGRVGCKQNLEKTQDSTDPIKSSSRTRANYKRFFCKSQDTHRQNRRNHAKFWEKLGDNYLVFFVKMFEPTASIPDKTSLIR